MILNILMTPSGSIISSLRYNNIDAKQYFWRITQQQEIDLIEENEGGLLSPVQIESKTFKLQGFVNMNVISVDCR